MSATKKQRLDESALETTPELEALVIALHEIGAVKVHFRSFNSPAPS